MSASSRRRARRQQTTALIAAGLHTRRSHYQTADIRDDVQTTIDAQRAMMDAHRKVQMDPSWEYDAATAREHAAELQEASRV